MIVAQKRLSIFLPSMRGGGAERSMLRLAEGISDRGYAVDLVLAQAEGPYLSEVSDGVRVVDLKASRVLSSLPALVRYLRREKPEALLSVMNHANVVATLARRLAGGPDRAALNEQITLSHTAKHSSQWRQRLMVPWCAKRFYPWADYLVGNSTGVADDLSELTGVPRQQVHVIYNPVVSPDLREKARAPLSHTWMQPNQPPVVLAVGRLKQHKDFAALIQAFAQIRKTRNCRLLILGEGPDQARLNALAKQLGVSDDVDLPGFVDNPYPYMTHAAVFVLSSRWEGLPTVLIEALYCGVRVVATDCPSGPREILREGKDGPLVPVSDVPALRQGIEDALDGKTPQPTEDCWRRFELEPVVDQYVDLLLKH